MKAAIFLLCSAMCMAQEPAGGRYHPKSATPDAYTVATPQGTVVMTCNKLGDGYHCDIAPGHTLDEAMTILIVKGK